MNKLRRHNIVDYDVGFKETFHDPWQIIEIVGLDVRSLFMCTSPIETIGDNQKN